MWYRVLDAKSITEHLQTIPSIKEFFGEDEVRFIRGKTEGEEVIKVQVVPDGSPALNYGFDVTPARLITGLITERGICKAEREEIESMFEDLL